MLQKLVHRSHRTVLLHFVKYPCYRKTFIFVLLVLHAVHQFCVGVMLHVCQQRSSYLRNLPLTDLVAVLRVHVQFFQHLIIQTRSHTLSIHCCALYTEHIQRKMETCSVVS